MHVMYKQGKNIHGVPVGTVRINHFVMDLTKLPKVHLAYVLKRQKQKQPIYVPVNSPRIHRTAMDRISKKVKIFYIKNADCIVSISIFYFDLLRSECRIYWMMDAGCWMLEV